MINKNNIIIVLIVSILSIPFCFIIVVSFVKVMNPQVSTCATTTSSSNIIISIEQDSLYKQLQAIRELSYFEGQKDCIEGNIRIAKDENGYYHWIKSPWDDNTNMSHIIYTNLGR